METETLLPKLHKRGLHFVLCKQTKAAIETGWPNTPPSLDSVLKHDAAGGLLGFVPSKSGLWVADVDKFPGEDVDARPLVERLGVSPLVTVRTKRGLHLYFKAGEDPIGNRAWSLDGGPARHRPVAAPPLLSGSPWFRE